MSTLPSKLADIPPLIAQIDPKFTVLIALLSVFVLTHLITSIQSSLALRASGDVKIPAIVPYSVPILGNVIPFAFNTNSFLRRVIQTYGRNIPVRIRILNQKIYYISGAQSVLALFKGSRDLTTVPTSIQFIENAFGSPHSNRYILENDNTGVYPKPLKGSNPIKPNNRIHYLQHVGFHEHLLGPGLKILAAEFMKNLEKELQALEFSYEEWTEVPDLYALVKKVVFRASTTALCGTKLFELNPNFEADFWEFDSHVPNLFGGLPRWLIPSAFKCRDRCKASIMKWHAYANEHFEWGDEASLKLDWEEIFGTRLMRERQSMYQKIDGQSAEGTAAIDLGMIFGANSNIIPLISWSLVDVLLRPDLLARTRSEIVNALEPTSKSQINMAKLLTQPLMQSIYSEELRLRNGTAIQRVPLIDNFKIGSWIFPKNQMIMICAWYEHRDRNVWNEGPVNGEFHSVEEFWPERFLTYPNNPSSGPRKPGMETKPRKAASEEEKDANEPVFSTDAVTGSFIPYGGGLKICPGRFYAKQEAIGAMGLFLTMFDIELVKDDLPKPNMSYFPFGVIPPLGEFPARIRRRRV